MPPRSLRRRFRLAAAVLCSVAIPTTWAIAHYQSEREIVRPADVLPAADCLLFVSADGLASERDAWQQSAAYEALVESGLVESISEYVQQLLDAQGIEDDEAEEIINSVIDQALDYGGAVAVYARASEAADQTPDDQTPDVVLAFANGNHMLDVWTEAYEYLENRGLLPGGVGAAEDGLRYVLSQGGASMTVWVERDVMYVTGPTAMADRLEKRRAAGGPSIRQHRLYPQSQHAVRAFADLELGLSVLDNAVPESKAGLTVRQVLDEVGLGGLQGWSGEAAFAGRAVETRSRLLIDPDNRGLLDFQAVPPLTLGDLPSLPEYVTAFSAARFDSLATFDAVIDGIRRFSRLAGGEAEDEFNEALDQAEAELGFPVRDLFAGLGDIIGAYDQTDAGLLAPPMVLYASVRDRSVVERVFSTLIDKLVDEMGDVDNVTVTRANEETYDRISISTGTPISVSFGLSDDWAVVAMTPSYLAEFFQRTGGDRRGWTPDAETLARLPELNGPFHNVQFVDTAGAWSNGLNVLPMGFAAIGQATGNQVPLPRLPRARKITRPLFPNVSVTVANETGLESHSSSSLFPPGNTFSAGGVSSVGLIGVGTALALPAVQASREAARRTVSKNNLKQLALSLYNYESVNRRLPAGTVLSSGDTPDERLSWMTEVAPYLEMPALSNLIDKDLAWNDPTNLEATAGVTQSVLANPNVELVSFDHQVQATTYAGCSGIGEDSAELPRSDRRAGVFGYEESAGLRDIRDGTTNTLMIGEVDQQLGPWTAGGQSTLRGFSEKPYINGPDGFGGGWAGGSQFAFADGAVRFVSENVDAKVAEALMTINGGEPVTDF